MFIYSIPYYIPHYVYTFILYTGTARMFTHGLGASLIENRGDHLVVDLSFLEKYTPRKG